jgi:hypothetical protein
MRFALVLLLAACGGSARRASPAASAAGGDEAMFVVAYRDATFFARPEGGERGRLQDARGESSPGDGVALRLVERDGDWVRVETLPGDPVGEHCHETAWSFAGLRLRLWVHARELAPVTTRRVEHRGADGSGAIVTAGVALGPVETNAAAPEGTEVRRVEHGRFSFPMAVPRDAVGTAFVLGDERFEDVETARAVRTELRADLGGLGMFAIRRDDYAAWADTPFVQEEAARGDMLLVVLQRRCAEVRLIVPASAVVDLSGPLGSLTGELAIVPPYVRAGVRLTFVDGSEAGVTTETVRLGAELRGAGERRCFEFWPELPLCAARGDVED